jgi:hypothetical protein
MKLGLPPPRAAVVKMDLLSRAIEGENQMKRLMTVAFALMIGLSLSMPAWAQTTPAQQNQAAARNAKQNKKTAKKARKQAAKKRKAAQKAAVKKSAGK